MRKPISHRVDAQQILHLPRFEDHLLRVNEWDASPTKIDLTREPSGV